MHDVHQGPSISDRQTGQVKVNISNDPTLQVYGCKIGALKMLPTL